jgi:hypothetical protein
MMARAIESTAIVAFPDYAPGSQQLMQPLHCQSVALSIVDRGMFSARLWR